LDHLTFAKLVLHHCDSGDQRFILYPESSDRITAATGITALYMVVYYLSLIIFPLFIVVVWVNIIWSFLRIYRSLSGGPDPEIVKLVFGFRRP